MESMINRELFDRAMNLKNSDKFNDSAKILLKLKKDVLDSAVDLLIINEALAQVYYLANMYEEALEYLKIVTHNSPEKELYSTALFDCYLELGDNESAFAELTRFLSNYPAIRYKVTLNDLLKSYEKDGFGIYKDLIFRLAKKHGVTPSCPES
jgi:tetratricopeptide (TPR) repeat protein